MSQSNSNPYYSDDIPAAIFADCLANSKNIFKLIDAVFPVDSCRHYQVLPLSLEGQNLSIGMIDPKNQESLKFVNSIANVFKYTLNIKSIDEQTIQIILASHPQNSQSSSAKNKNNEALQNRTVIDEAFDPSAFSLSNQVPRKRVVESAPTIIAESEAVVSQPKPKKDKDFSGLEDLPADLDFLKDLDLSSPQNSKTSKSKADQAGTIYEIPPEFLQQQQSKRTNKVDSQKTMIAENLPELPPQEESELKLAEAQISELLAEVSSQKTELEAELEKAESADFLPQLNSQLSWQNLLEQAFKHHSEEIILTRHSDRGSVISQKDRLSQSALENVALPIFCSLIDEIKRMAKIPLDLSNHPKKVVLERFYQEERILLRTEFTVKEEKEVVIVQILRNKNLIAYEQKQMDKVSDQALYLARQLEKTLRKIQVCFESAEFKSLRELQTIQSRINHQLRLLDKQ